MGKGFIALLAHAYLHTVFQSAATWVQGRTAQARFKPVRKCMLPANLRQDTSGCGSTTWAAQYWFADVFAKISRKAYCNLYPALRYTGAAACSPDR